MHLAIEIKKLIKTFSTKNGVVQAVRGIDLIVHSGEIFGFLGPNGAGKTTTMRMLTTLLKPTSGTATVAGLDLMSQAELIRYQIGYVSQTGGLERSASARENMVLQGRIYGLSSNEAHIRAEELIKAFRLEEFADRQVETYSGGQRRRTDIALGLVHKPKILFLDEPTVGLDPQNRANVWDEIRRLHQNGTTIFLTTHYLDEADALCNRIAIVDHGNIVALGTPKELKQEIASDIIVLGLSAEALESLNPEILFAPLAESIRQVTKEKDALRLLVQHGESLLPHLLRICDKAGITFATISLHHPTLDDVFLQKTGHSFTENNN